MSVIIIFEKLVLNKFKMTVFNFNLSNIFYFTRNNPESHYKLCIKLLLMSMAFKSEIYSTNIFLSIRPIDKNIWHCPFP